MAENSKIEWTDHTTNFWWGCEKVSQGCKNCYAETFSKRVGRNIWGPAATTERWRTKSPWHNILKWDRKAGELGIRQRVFVQSMSDFFEDHPQVEPWRQEAISILEGVKNLDILLLTKRIDRVRSVVPDSWMYEWPSHIWMGTSVEDQETANYRIPFLIDLPAPIRWLSMEPLLDPVDLVTRGQHQPDGENCAVCGGIDHQAFECMNRYDWLSRLSWIIVGGESGHGARPMNPVWARALRDQCQETGIAFHFKQWGAWSSDGVKLGKKQSGRILDGRTWDEFPKPTEAISDSATEV